jgi:hypothetical protein
MAGYGTPDFGHLGIPGADETRLMLAILSIDLKSVLRKRKPAQRTSQLVPWPRAELAGLTALPGGRLDLLLDTKV